MKENIYIPKKFIIFGKILSSPSHIREISRETKINPMSVKKIADEFVKKKVLDFEIKGKNKIFYIKENLESRNMKLIYELYKKIEVVNNYPFLREIFNKISENKKIKLALLFGSYAKNLAHKESDVDIYIETNSIELKKEVEMINSKISVKIGKFDKENLLIKEIMKKCIIIKGIERYYEN